MKEMQEQERFEYIRKKASDRPGLIRPRRPLALFGSTTQYEISRLRSCSPYYSALSSTLFSHSSIVPITEETQPSSNGEIKPAELASSVKDWLPPRRHSAR